MVESSMRYSMSRSEEKCSNSFSKTLSSLQREKRLETEFQLPYLRGKSRHCAPERVTHKTASRKRRQSRPAPSLTCGQVFKTGRIFCHWSSVSLTVILSSSLASVRQHNLERTTLNGRCVLLLTPTLCPTLEITH